MTPQAIINETISYVYNIDVADAGNTDRRARVLTYLQDVIDEFWIMREWAFSFKEATVSVATTGVGPLPADYLELGNQGGVYDSNGVKLEEITFPELKRLLIRNQTQNPPAVFCIIANGGSLELRTPVVGSSTPVYLHYRTIPPTVVDDTTEIPSIPKAHHDTVLSNGTFAEAAWSIGDPRTDHEQAYQAGIRRALIVERSRKTSIQRMPRAVPNMW